MDKIIALLTYAFCMMGIYVLAIYYSVTTKEEKVLK